MLLSRGYKLFLALGAIPPAISTYTFVNPASHGGQTTFTQNAVYAEKSIVEIQWTVGATDEDATVALWQVNASSTSATSTSIVTIGDLEYIAGALYSCPLCHIFFDTPVERHTDTELQHHRRTGADSKFTQVDSNHGQESSRLAGLYDGDLCHGS